MPAPAPPSLAAEAGEGALRHIVERVLAWQHRQPLARRISPQDVVGVGIIALPYAESAAPGARPGELRPLFQQPRLLPGLSQRELVDFAARHAVAERPGPADWPLRSIDRADAPGQPAPVTRYLLTAAVNDARLHGVSPHRLLLAPGGSAVWGRRAWSRPRLLIAAGAALVAALAWLAWGGIQWRPAMPPPIIHALPEGPASAASIVAPREAPTGRPEPAPSAAAPQTPAAEASVPPGPAPEPLAAVPAGPHYALVSAPAKQRAAAEATLQRVRQLLGPAMGTLQAQIMPSPQGYVVTIWPLPTQADAERLAEVLARRGVAMKWMEF